VRNIARVDLDTGEILAKEPTFVKSYVEQISKVTGLTGAQHKVLWFLLTKMQFDNSVSLKHKVKAEFIKNGEVSLSSFSNCISALAKTGLIEIEGPSQYLINPEYFSKCDWGKTKGMIAQWTFTDNGTEFKRKIIDENGEVIIEEDE
jgi:hypothetical protein